MITVTVHMEQIIRSSLCWFSRACGEPGANCVTCYGLHESASDTRTQNSLNAFSNFIVAGMLSSSPS